MRSSLRVAGLVLALACFGCGKRDATKPPGPSEEAQRAMGRGVGYLEAFRYQEAVKELAKAVSLAPHWTDAKVNYTIALLNAQSARESGENLEEKALDLALQLAKEEPDNPHALFLAGFLLLHTRGEADEALQYLARIKRKDASVHFWMGQAQRERGSRHLEEALAEFDEAIRLDPHMAAAYYGRFGCLTLIGSKEQSAAAKRDWLKHKSNIEDNRLTAKAYHEISTYALAIRRYPGGNLSRKRFAWKEHPAGELDAYTVPGTLACVAIADIDGDGDYDLYLPGALFENRGGLVFRKKAAFPPLPGLFFDYNRDTVSDLFLYGTGADHLYRGPKLEEVTVAAGLAGAYHSWFAFSGDLDMDGDNDLFVTDTEGPDRFLRNNRDGTFTAVLIGKPGPSRGALPFDYDHDHDPDLLIASASGPPAKWRNDRGDGFRADGYAPQGPGPLLVAADTNRDGFEEVRAVDSPVLFGDVDLDGDLDEVDLPGMRSGALADLDGDGVPERITVDAAGKVHLCTAAVDHPGHWIAFALRGRDAAMPPQWAAPMGPGSRLEIFSANRWQLRVARSVSGLRSQEPPWVPFGLGNADMLDVVRIEWPDRVLQAELDLPVDAVKTIQEANRKPSSCPLLFVEEPGRVRYVTDFLGSGGLGFFLEPGVYGKPDPDELIRIGAMRPVDGNYVLHLLEPLEELSYLDEATLLAVDHPGGIEVFPDERFAGEPPFPACGIWEIAKRITPRAACNRKGEDLLDRILAVDRKYPPIELDKRFKGFAKEHCLGLDFTGRIPELKKGEHLILLLDGWVEYGYSHSNFAAGQAGAVLSPPKLEQPGPGGWRTVIENTGYPAGLPRTMTLDVTGVVTPSHPIFRLRTNLEVYWDRVTLGVDHGKHLSRITRLAPDEARLTERGYPREYSPDGAIPLVYDYALSDPTYPFKILAGDYTRFGEVGPLVTTSDDRFVIFGRGEELILRYAAHRLPPLAKGRRRTFLLYATGYCKDMDPYTAYPDTVEPLPFRAMSNYPYPPGEHYPDDAVHKRYRREWNTRRVGFR